MSVTYFNKVNKLVDSLIGAKKRESKKGKSELLDAVNAELKEVDGLQFIATKAINCGLSDNDILRLAYVLEPAPAKSTQAKESKPKSKPKSKSKSK